MTDWFDKTNAQDAFASTTYTRTVLHGQAEKGSPLSDKSYIIALSGIRHEDGADLLRNKADDGVWDDLSTAFDTLYRTNLADKNNSMWLINFIRRADLGDNVTNNQIAEVHIHVLSGQMTPGNEFIPENRNFHPHPNKDIYTAFAENKADITGRDVGHGIKIVPLPAGVKEAEQHYAITGESYKSFPDFMDRATKEEKRDFWKAVAMTALPLVENEKGARVGYYNLDGAADKTGHMVVEVAGGENLGQNGAKNRWIQKPVPKT